MSEIKRTTLSLPTDLLEKTDEVVDVMIPGPHGIFICEDCVEILGAMLRFERQRGRNSRPALRLSIAGNIIDLGVSGEVPDGALRAAVEQALAEPVHGLVDELRRDIERADDILYLADNCGEIVFDRGRDDVQFVLVGGGPALEGLKAQALEMGLVNTVVPVDQLEEEGVIGPADGNKPREVLWREEGDEADYAEFEKDVAGEPVE